MAAVLDRETENLQDIANDLATKSKVKGRKQLKKVALKRLARAVAAFCEILAGVELYDYQREFVFRICYSLLSADNARITGLFSRQSGKTEAVAVVCNGCMVILPVLAEIIPDWRVARFKDGVFVGCFAPSHNQVQTLFSRIKLRLHSKHSHEIMRDPDIGIDFDDDKMYFSASLPNGSFVQCGSAAPNAQIEGTTYHLIILDEAQDIATRVVRKSISPMGAAVGGMLVKIGTCNMQVSDFYQQCQMNASEDMNRSDLDLRTHFQYDYQVAASFNPLYAAYVKTEMANTGYDSDEFRMAYRLHWLLERGMFVGATELEAMGLSDKSPTTVDRKNPTVMGIDVAKLDAETVATVIKPDHDRGVRLQSGEWRAHKSVVNWLALSGDKYDDQARLLVDFMKNYPALTTVHIDATGVGEVLADFIEPMMRTDPVLRKAELVRFYASTPTNHRGYSHLLGDLQNLRIDYPNSSRSQRMDKVRKFKAQMMSIRKFYQGPYLSAELDETSTELHKDFVSSLMLAVLAADAVNNMPEIEETADPGIFKGRGIGGRTGFSRRSW